MSVAPVQDTLAVVRTIVVSARSASVAEVREAVALDLARGSGRDELTSNVICDVVLVLSELVSNAVKHARPLASGGIRVTWSVQPSAVMVSVTDGGATTRPRVQAVSPSGTGGRGLSIVSDVCSDWGLSEAPGELTVWAVLGRAARHQSRSPELSPRTRD